MPEPLKLECAEMASETLEIYTEETAPQDWCFLRLQGTMLDDNLSLTLNEETARQLFNWLAVWLHEFR